VRVQRLQPAVGAGHGAQVQTGLIDGDHGPTVAGV
jgi:hypothetical protein